jgi:hypothetical protein
LEENWEGVSWKFGFIPSRSDAGRGKLVQAIAPAMPATKGRAIDFTKVFISITGLFILQVETFRTEIFLALRKFYKKK